MDRGVVSTMIYIPSRTMDSIAALVEDMQRRIGDKAVLSPSRMQLGDHCYQIEFRGTGEMAREPMVFTHGVHEHTTRYIQQRDKMVDHDHIEIMSDQGHTNYVAACLRDYALLFETLRATGDPRIKQQLNMICTQMRLFFDL